jgi:hypothetical protein
MIPANRNLLSSILTLKVEKPDHFNRVKEWIQSSLARQALAIADAVGDENTNIAKGRIKELKELEMYFGHTEDMIKEIDSNTEQSISKPDYLS